MAKRKGKDAKGELTLDDLVKLAESTDFDPDILDGDLEDAADDERELILENVRSEGVRGRLEFLYQHGFTLARLEEVIRKKNADPFAD